MSSPAQAVLGLGSNLGDRLATLEAALFSLDDSDGIAVLDASGVYETAPWGGVEQEPYLNAVVVVETALSPHALLAECHAIEAAFGRDRTQEERWGPRTLDIDVLLYGDAEIRDDVIEVPHPRLRERAFVLVPMIEVLPGATLPDGTRLTTLLAALAPVEGIDLHVRFEDPPGRRRAARPEGPAGPGAYLAQEWDARGEQPR